MVINGTNGTNGTEIAATAQMPRNIERIQYGKETIAKKTKNKKAQQKTCD
ncbi:unnamed protein product [marine sediment metagenome]|uniref:Uncharacterized protein n=1 Tax=marine sediment metagenome TaxID=412755 RepID=X0X8W0_9ZZZZ